MEEKTRDHIKLVLIILIVVSLGLLAVNQFLEWKFKAKFLGGPCGLCAELNPNQSKCIQECFIVKETLYSDGFGNWAAQPKFMEGLEVNQELK